jgi:hypothetical protein
MCLCIIVARYSGSLAKSLKTEANINRHIVLPLIAAWLDPSNKKRDLLHFMWV